jgi:hypothetical protein
MVKGSGRTLKPFSRDQLFVSIYESCKHRSSAASDATALTLVVIGDLLALARSGILERDDVARVTHKVLKRFDAAAATYYAAYHPFPANG